MKRFMKRLWLRISRCWFGEHIWEENITPPPLGYDILITEKDCLICGKHVPKFQVVSDSYLSESGCRKLEALLKEVGK